MKHLLHMVVENGGAHWLLVFNPTDGALVHSQPLALDALGTLLQDDMAALLASLEPLAEDRPEPFGDTQMLILGRDGQDRVLFACGASATSWDGTENTDGYGYWRSARYRFRIVEVTSTGVVPVVEFNRSSLLKESAVLSGDIFDCFDNSAYFFCQPVVADNSTVEDIVKLELGGAITATTWAGFGFQTEAFFTTEAGLFAAIAEQSE